jgi:hypothetical protein
MLAITVSLLTAIYLLGPDLVSRFILGFVVPRRIIQQSKGEEIARAVLTAAIPLSLAIMWTVWHHAVTWQDIKPDFKTVFSGLYSEKLFDCDPEGFFKAARSVSRANWSVTWRLYSLLIVYSIVVDFVILNYGAIRNSKWFDKRDWRKKVLAIFILPRVSEWHVLLTSFSHQKSTRITADILTKSDVLYRGTIEKPFLDPGGSLSGLLISDPFRYDRQRYVDDKKTGNAADKDVYWRKIPSNTFLMLAAEIATINLRRYDTEDVELNRRIQQILNEKLTVQWSPSPDNPISIRKDKNL